ARADNDRGLIATGAGFDPDQTGTIVLGEVERALHLLLGLSGWLIEAPTSQRHLLHVPFGQRFCPLTGLIYPHQGTLNGALTGLSSALPPAPLITWLSDANQSTQTRRTRNSERVLTGQIGTRLQLIIERF